MPVEALPDRTLEDKSATRVRVLTRGKLRGNWVAIWS